MPVNAALVIATAVLAVTMMAVALFIAARVRRAREAELQRAALTRGWTFESASVRGYSVHRWIGTTDGVPWRAESWHSLSRKNRQRRPDLARWHTDFSPGLSSPIVCMAVPKGKAITAAPAQPGDGLLVKLAQKAFGFAFDKAIDLYFGDALGKDVDAGAMHRVDSKAPGFVVMAADKSEGARILASGLEQHLTTAASDPASALAGEQAASILLRPHGISLAKLGELDGVEDVERFTRAGVGLTRSSKFARPFA
jgi:hypothetical protein